MPRGDYNQHGAKGVQYRGPRPDDTQLALIALIEARELVILQAERLIDASLRTTRNRPYVQLKAAVHQLQTARTTYQQVASVVEKQHPVGKSRGARTAHKPS